VRDAPSHLSCPEDANRPQVFELCHGRVW
jgi:hypothetical protein